jgi:histidinol-phosphate aminotransferase
MSLFRPSIDRIQGYVPGEQPQESGWTKLNTNENPYPPSPEVVAAIQDAATGRLNVYPDPLGESFCAAAAARFNVEPEWILPGNGSDENLTILTRSFVDSDDLVTFPYPSYTLYKTLADIQGVKYEHLLLNDDWSWDFDRVGSQIDRSKLLFAPNPNSPSGNCWSQEDTLKLVPPTGILVLDEAYGDFADQPHRAQLLHGDKGNQIVITRTLSKSYSLAGIRFGFAIAHPDIIAGMRKVKDSYNCDAIALAAATAAIQDDDWMLANTRRIQTTRARLTDSLKSLGFNVVPSEANFVWTTHEQPHEQIFEALKKRKILLRYMKFLGSFGDKTVTGLRITIGTDTEIDGLLVALKEIL